MEVSGTSSAYTIKEYLAFEEETLMKHEFHNGEVLAMSGGTLNHSTLSGNMLNMVLNDIRKTGKGCRPFNGDVRIYFPLLNSFVYPDLSVVCGNIETSEQDKNAIINPGLIVEVLSESTEKYDRSGKFRKYRSLPSFREYVLIDQYQPVVDVLFRSDENYWKIISYIGLEKEVYINTLDCSIKMSDIYRDVEGLSEPELQLPF